MRLYQMQDGELVAIPDTRDIEVQRQEYIAMAADARWQASSTFSYNGMSGVASDDQAQGRLTATMAFLQTAIAAGQASASTTIPWNITPGVTQNMTLAELQAFGMAMGAFVQSCWAYQASLVAQLTAATDLDALNAIDVYAGWPTS